MSILDRSQTPAAGEMRDFEFPPIEKLDLECGMAMHVVHQPRLPVVSVRLFIDAGEDALDHDHAGLSVLTGDALLGGTLDRSGIELAEALESIGADLGVVTGWDATTVHLSCLADRLDEAFALLAEVVRRPGFPEDEVSRIRDQQLGSFTQRAMEPSAIAADRLLPCIFRDGSPYSRPSMGTRHSVSRIDSEATHAYASQFYKPGRGGLVVAGDVDSAEVGEIANRHLSGWSGAPPPRNEVDTRARQTERRIVVVARPGAVQSEIRIGHVGVPRSFPGYFPLRVFNTVLGGAFTSRLNLNLREENGFTYGVRSQFSFRRHAGLWVVGAAVGTDVTAAAVREAMSEITTMVREGPTDDELEAARDFLAGVFPLGVETTGQLASKVESMLVHNLAPDYYATYRDRVREVTRETATGAGQDAIRPAEATILVVGDPDEIVEPLRALELGEIEVVEHEATS